MAGLIPIGGGDDQSWTCFRCGEPAFGPCAFCRLMICSGDECSKIIEEPGLPKTVLCTECARCRPFSAAHRVTAPVLIVLGALLVVVAALSGIQTLVAGVAYLVAGALVLLGLASALSRWQWRARLRSARRPPGR